MCAAVALLGLVVSGFSDGPDLGTTYRALSAPCSCTGASSLGESGSTGVADCQRFCSADPRCRVVVYTSGGQCAWASRCDAAAAAVAGGRATEKAGQPQQQRFAKVGTRSTAGPGWFWASTDDLSLPTATVLWSGGTTVKGAIARCTALANCTSLGFTATDGPLTTATVAAYLFDDRQIIDPSPVTDPDTWLYYKNGSAIAFCDLQLLQSVAGAGKATRIALRWRQCSAGLTARLAVNGTLVGDAVPLVDGAALEIPSNATPAGSWEVAVVSVPEMGRQPVLSLPVEIVAPGTVCNRDGLWVAARATDSTSLPCWTLNGSAFATGFATRRCQPGGAWAEPDVTGCSAGGWTRCELAFITLFGITDQGGQPIIGGHTSPYDPDVDFFHWLAYFPGNKIYGFDWNDDLEGCASQGSFDIPGNMADPRFRRMQLGSNTRLRAAAPGGSCAAFTQSAHFSVGEESGATYLDVTLNASRAADGAFSVTVEGPHSMGRAGVQAQVLPYRGMQIARIVLWDTEEARCLAALRQVCHPAGGSDGKACSLCALGHLPALNRSGCLEEQNLGDVAQFWCDCTPDKGDNGCGCGGEPYPPGRRGLSVA